MDCIRCYKQNWHRLSGICVILSVVEVSINVVFTHCGAVIKTKIYFALPLKFMLRKEIMCCLRYIVGFVNSGLLWNTGCFTAASTSRLQAFNNNRLYRPMMCGWLLTQITITIFFFYLFIKKERKKKHRINHD